MDTVRTVSRGIVWTTASSVVAKVVGFTNVFIILTHLSVYEYGLTELTFSIVSTAGLFLLPGLAATVTADLAVERSKKEYGQMKALFFEFFSFNMALGIIAWAILFFGSSLVAHLSGNDLIGQFFKIVAFLFLTSPLRVVSTMLATVMVRYADQSFYSVVEEIAKGIALVVFFYVFDRGADGLLFAAVTAQVAAILFFAPRTISAYREFSHAKMDEREPLWNILREHRKWSVASSYVSTLGGNLRIWIVKLLLGTEAVGIFAVAQGLLSQITGLFNMSTIIGPLVPFYLNDPRRLKNLIVRATKYQIIVALLIVMGGAFAVPILIWFVFPKYAAAIPLFLLSLPILIPNLVKSVHQSVYTAFKQQRGIFNIEAVRVVLMCAVLVPGIWFFGIFGIAFEMVITTTFTMVERWRALKTLIPGFQVPLRSLFSLDANDRTLVRDMFNRSGRFWTRKRSEWFPDILQDI